MSKSTLAILKAIAVAIAGAVITSLTNTNRNRPPPCDGPRF